MRVFTNISVSRPSTESLSLQEMYGVREGGRGDQREGRGVRKREGSEREGGEGSERKGGRGRERERGREG